MQLATLLQASGLLALTYAIHTSPQELAQKQTSGSDSTVPLIITNRCRDTIWPGIETQGGGGPEANGFDNGFELSAGAQKNITVATNWNGRVWARTNCTFDGDGKGSCGTGDCGGILNCTSTGAAATLAEFNLPAYRNQSFYDISLVDGYNLPLAIQVIPNDNNKNPSPNNTNPSCVGSVEYLASRNFDPYTSGQQLFLGTSSSQPLPFDTDIDSEDASTWYVKHPPFNPCLSACSKYGDSKFCCTGKHDKASKCGPNYYSRAAKRICPDAYSYAFDDDKSTFAVPMGSGFEIVFCPGGRSTTILKTLKNPGGVASAASDRASMDLNVGLVAVLVLILAIGLG